MYNIETALPVIDMETIENHLKLVKDDERRVSIIFENPLQFLLYEPKDDFLKSRSSSANSINRTDIMCYALWGVVQLGNERTR